MENEDQMRGAQNVFKEAHRSAIVDKIAKITSKEKQASPFRRKRPLCSLAKNPGRKPLFAWRILDNHIDKPHPCRILWSDSTKGVHEMSRCEGEGSGSENDRGCCNSKSACALKDIIDDLDNLNNRDLRTLDDLIDRILCCHSDDRK